MLSFKYKSVNFHCAIASRNLLSYFSLCNVRFNAIIELHSIRKDENSLTIGERIKEKGEFFGLLIKGDSMVPTLYDGDTVIVERTEDAASGDLVIATVNSSDATCKRLQKYAEGLALIPHNPIYAPIRYTNAEVDSTPVRILGKVVEMRRKF